MDEIEFAIGEVDPKKTIEMGFRIDPQGRQKVKKVSMYMGVYKPSIS